MSPLVSFESTDARVASISMNTRVTGHSTGFTTLFLANRNRSYAFFTLEVSPQIVRVETMISKLVTEVSWYVTPPSTLDSSFEFGAATQISQVLQSPSSRALPPHHGIQQLVVHHQSLHDIAVQDDVARVVSRLLCGGQGLKSGDPAVPSQLNLRKCCLFCLSYGRATAETLEYFLFGCPLTKTARSSSKEQACWERKWDIAKHHRDVCRRSASSARFGEPYSECGA